MAHSLATVAATTTTTTTTTPISTKSKKTILHIPSLGFQRVWACHHQHSKQVLDDHKLILRRNVTLGVAGAVLGLSVSDRSAYAARRPPAPPPEEKKDPNVTGVQAKVLASKKRKEAMKQTMAKLREKGKAVNEPVKEPTNEPSE